MRIGAFLIATVMTVSGQPTDDSKPIERELRANEEHVYGVDLQPGEMLHAVAEQETVDVALLLKDSNGKVLVDRNRWTWRGAPERLMFQAAVRSRLSLVVKSAAQRSPGRYRLLIRKEAPSSQDDGLRNEMDSRFWWRDLQPVTKEVSEQTRLAMLAAQLESFRQLINPDSTDKAFHVDALIRLSYGQDNAAKREELLNRALRAAREFQDWRVEGHILKTLAYIHEKRPDSLESTLARLAEAQAVYEAHNAPEYVAETLSAAGNTLMRHWRDDEARVVLTEGLRYCPKTDMRFRVSILSQLGSLERRNRRPQQAVRHFQEILPAARLGYHTDTWLLNNLGMLFESMGDLAAAQKHFQEAYDIDRSRGGWRGSRQSVLENVVRVKSTSFTGVQEGYRLWLAEVRLCEAAKDPNGVRAAAHWAAITAASAYSLRKVHGTTFADLTQWLESLFEGQQSSPLVVQHRVLIKMQSVMTAAGRSERFAALRDSLRNETEPTIKRLKEAGKADAALTLRMDYLYNYDLWSRVSDWRVSYLAAMEEVDSLTRKEQLPYLIGLARLGLVRNHQVRAEAARLLERARTVAVSHPTSIWENRGELEELVAAYELEKAQSSSEAIASSCQWPSWRNNWALMTACLKAFRELGQLNKFELVLDQQVARVRSLGNSPEWEQFVRHSAAQFAGLLLEVGANRANEQLALELIDEVRSVSLMDRLRRRDEGGVFVRGDLDLLQGIEGQLSEAAETQLGLQSSQAFQLRHELVQKASTLRGDLGDTVPAPDLAPRKAPNALQDVVKDGRSVLLEYVLNGDQSFGMAHSASGQKTFRLPNSKLLDLLIEKAYGLVSATDNTWDPRQGLKELSESLIAPVKETIAGKRLLVVLRGTLERLPFAALPDPNSPDRPLVENHEIVYIPSATSLATLRARWKTRPLPPKSVAVLADPVYADSDNRLRRLSASNAPVSSRSRAPSDHAKMLSRAGFNTGTLPSDSGPLARLPFTRREAKLISTLSNSSDDLVVTDFRANLRFVASGTLSDYKIVHFATHGFVSDVPELSGLALSVVNEAGQSVPGLLKLYDIQNLKLPAELVVLSACQTAIGLQAGSYALPQGFFVAGAKRVVASLWKVDDRGTAEFMKYFYEGLLRDRLSPSAALRKAQVSMQRSKAWSNPYYWAAFALHGEPD